eukprot:CAMPEP_0119337762 /NCGR_PEP_ID=MMETSP1333-20130426/94658_1 /TAXON_ID=418940 /ORGANISM="Scyphosphaera apsteinii, Strain RCC1455" /LENGTH=306 /DNA_ID=CAMNT_0007348881 /DNA_START=51 /DNA_END=971 /DNA_ORIENTATION=-
MSLVDSVGKTAFVVNSWRATENASEEPLFYDSFSGIFMNQFSTDSLLHFDQCLAGRAIKSFMGPRTLFIDEALRSEIASGVQQVVLLGSGLDCRALRFFHPEVKFFEVDRQAVLEFKSSMLREKGFTHYPSKLIMGDYLEIDLIQSLLSAGVDPRKRILFIWEGNTFYLPTQRGKALLKRMLEAFPKARVVLDTMSLPLTSLNTGETKADSFIQSMFDLVSHGKNLWLGPWSIAEYAEELGYRVIESVSMYDAIERYRTTTAIQNLYGSMDAWKTTFTFFKFYDLSILEADGKRGCFRCSKVQACL